MRCKENEIKGIHRSLHVITNHAEAQGKSGFVPWRWSGRNATPKQFEKTKQEICKAFEANNLGITIEANKNCRFLRSNLGPNQPKL